VEEARAELPILLGVEANVVSVDGHIDIPPKLLNKLDIVLFGVHVAILYSLRGWLFYQLPNIFFNTIHIIPQFLRNRNTTIVKRVLKNNKIDIWTHPNRYFKINILEAAKVAAERGTLVELNAKKISFRPIDFERMVAMGCKFIINTDSHSPRRIGEISRVEEFLKHCDYNPACIINLNTTLSEYKNNKKDESSDTNKNQDPNPAKKPKRWRRWF
jgi:putative hydrolase